LKGERKEKKKTKQVECGRARSQKESEKKAECGVKEKLKGERS
jgi:hypothetical protein